MTQRDVRWEYHKDFNDYGTDSWVVNTVEGDESESVAEFFEEETAKEVVATHNVMIDAVETMRKLLSTGRGPAWTEPSVKCPIAEALKGEMGS